MADHTREEDAAVEAQIDRLLGAATTDDTARDLYLSAFLRLAAKADPADVTAAVDYALTHTRGQR